MNKYIAEGNIDNFVVAMIDIDDFKMVNDTYGHDTGDKVIVELSRILSSGTNHYDLVSRFGGEEFCVVLKNTNLNNANEILNRIRLEIEANTTYSDTKDAIKFTVSIGASLYDGEEKLDEVINQADMKLYNAKKSGKNQVQI